MIFRCNDPQISRNKHLKDIGTNLALNILTHNFKTLQYRSINI